MASAGHLGLMRSTEGDEDFKKIMASAIFVPFPKYVLQKGALALQGTSMQSQETRRLLEQEPKDQIGRLELSLSQHDQHVKQVRANIERLFHNSQSRQAGIAESTQPEPSATEPATEPGDDAARVAKTKRQNDRIVADLKKRYDPKVGIKILAPYLEPRPNQQPEQSQTDPRLPRSLECYRQHATEIRRGLEGQLNAARSGDLPARISSGPSSRPSSRPGTSAGNNITPFASSSEATITRAPAPLIDPRLRRKLSIASSWPSKDRSSLESGEITAASTKSTSVTATAYKPFASGARSANAVPTVDPRLARRFQPAPLNLAKQRPPLESGEVTPESRRSSSLSYAPNRTAPKDVKATPLTAPADPRRLNTLPIRSPGPAASATTTPSTTPGFRASARASSTTSTSRTDAPMSFNLPPRPRSPATFARNIPIWAQPTKRKASTELLRHDGVRSPKRRLSGPEPSGQARDDVPHTPRPRTPGPSRPSSRPNTPGNPAWRPAAPGADLSPHSKRRLSASTGVRSAQASPASKSTGVRRVDK